MSDWTTELSGQLDTVEYAFATAKYDRLKDDINEALLELKDPKYNDKTNSPPLWSNTLATTPPTSHTSLQTNKQRTSLTPVVTPQVFFVREA